MSLTLSQLIAHELLACLKLCVLILNRYASSTKRLPQTFLQVLRSTHCGLRVSSFMTLLPK